MSCCKTLKKSIKIGHEHFSKSNVHSENNKKIEINLGKNRSICKIIIDDGLIADKTKEKCDCLFYVCPDGYYIFVELKGKKWPKPYNQIISTINYLKEDLKLAVPKEKIQGIVVSGGIPKVRQDIRDKTDEFVKKVGSRLIVRTDHYSHKI